MNVIEAGIVPATICGGIVGATLFKSAGALKIAGGIVGGVVGGAFAGGLLALLVIFLMSIIGVLWRAGRKRPEVPLAEADMDTMQPIAVRGTACAVMASTVVFLTTDWMQALIVLLAGAFVVAFAAVARWQLLKSR